jgi:ribonuclease HI
MRVYTDGGSRGNPGPAAIGVVLCDDYDRVVTTVRERIGRATNNQAEYRAVLKGLELVSHRVNERIDFFSDSELVVRQLNGAYRVKNKALKPLHDRVVKLASGFKKVVFTHLPRSNRFISMADEMVNAALDGV